MTLDIIEPINSHKKANRKRKDKTDEVIGDHEDREERKKRRKKEKEREKEGEIDDTHIDGVAHVKKRKHKTNTQSDVLQEAVPDPDETGAFILLRTSYCVLFLGSTV